MTITTPETGNLLYSDIEQDLRQSVRALLSKRADWTSILSRTESDETTDRALWQSVAGDLGCAAMPIPEDLGGAGASWRESAVVAEELGRAVAPIPYLGAAGIATALLLELGAQEQLEKLASAETTAVLAVPFSSAPWDPISLLPAHGGTVEGEVRGVVDAGIADLILVPTADGLYLVDANSEGVTITEAVSLDMTRPIADIALGGAAGLRLAPPGEELDSAISHALRVGSVLLASEQLGIAEHSLEMTIEYVKTRRQFNRIIGSYQAIKHRLADLWVQITEARAVARYAAECAATNSADLPVAASLAQAVCSHVAQIAVEEAIQLHGGIGFTWEHPAHLYLKRAKADAIGFGTAEAHRTELARLLDLQAAAPTLRKES